VTTDDRSAEPDDTFRTELARLAAPVAEEAWAGEGLGGPLRCTYCGGRLVIYSETVGPAYLTYETPESVQCDDCDATWEPNGELRDPAKWIRWPDVYQRPAAVAAPAATHEGSER
jgi:hypothetical protein